MPGSRSPPRAPSPRSPAPCRRTWRDGSAPSRLPAHRPATGGHAQADPAVLVRIGEAVAATEELRFEYDGSGSGSRSGGGAAGSGPLRTTEPHHLLLRAGRWYLLGYTPDRSDWRTYRVDRITPHDTGGRRFTRRSVPGGDAVRFTSARFKGSSTSDVWPCVGDAVVRAPLHRIAPYIGDGAVEALDGERCRVRMGSWSWAGLAATMARFDADIESAGPPELTRAFGDLAVAACASS